MSGFVALNVYEEDIIHDAEQHTRELQIEEGYKIFQEALRCQKDREIDKAHEQYSKLFAIEIMKLSHDTGLPQAAEKLKYLAFKNHALLLLLELEEEIYSMDQEELVQRLDDIMLEFSEALIYDSTEQAFLELICALALPLRYVRVARLALECLVYSENRVTSFESVLKSGDFLSPNDYQLLTQLLHILESIGDDISIADSEVLKLIKKVKLNPSFKLTTRDYSWIVREKDVTNTYQKLLDRENNRDVTITITTKDWMCIVSSIQETLYGMLKTKRKLTFEDPYAYSVDPITRVKFTMPHEHVAFSNGTASSEEPDAQDVEMETRMVAIEEEKTVPTGEEEVQTDKVATDATNKLSKDEPAVAVEKAKPAEVKESIEPANKPQIEASMMDIDSEEKIVQELEAVSSTAPSDTNTGTDIGRKRRKSESEDNKHRSSKRVRARAGEDQTLNNVDTDGDEEFFENLNYFLQFAGLHFESVLPAFTGQNTIKPVDQCLIDFKNLLLSWEDDQAELFLRNDRGNKKNKNQSVMQLLDFAALGDSEIVKPPFSGGSEEVDNFMAKVNAEKMHFQQVRIELILFLLCQRKDGYCSLLSDHWPTSLFDGVKRVIEEIEPHLYSEAKKVVLDSAAYPTEMNLKRLFIQLEVCESIFEFFVDGYLSVTKSLRNSRDKQLAKSMEIVKQASLSRVSRWRGICNDVLGAYYGPIDSICTNLLRHEWVSIICGQLEEEDPTDSLKNFEIYQKKLTQLQPNLVVEFSNFSNIPRLSTESVTTQIAKYRAASIFARIFEMEDEEDQKDDGDTSEKFDKITVLESILMPDEHKVLIPEHLAIQQFLATASLEFRLQLWYLLLDTYDKNGQRLKSFYGYLRILDSSVDEFVSSQYSNFTDHQKSVVLLRSLNICLDITRKLTGLIMDDDGILDGLSTERLKMSLDSLIHLLRLLHMFILLDDAINNNVIQAPSHPSWDRASRLIKELIVRAWSLLYMFFKIYIPEEKRTKAITNDILSIIHEEIGVREYCGLGDGFFLDLSLRELVKLDWPESEADMLQCLDCRYGFGLGNDYFQPINHHTNPGDIHRPAALQLVKFIMSLVMRKKNLSNAILRSEMKSVLDQFHDALGNPDVTVPSLAHNSHILNDFLDLSHVPTRFFDDSMHGRLNLSFVDSRDKIVPVAQSGFYYVLGHAEFSLYKIRKRTHPGRTEDLEEAIKFFKYDLICNTNRFEAWFSLSQAYDALAEADLTLNADKINSPEQRRIATAHQRQSILACGMAISVYLRNRSAQLLSASSHYKQLVTNLWQFFARILYNACREPMKMEAFSDGSEKLFCGKDYEVYKKVPNWGLTTRAVLKTVRYSLILAKNANPSDWYNYYLMAKVLRALGMEPDQVTSLLVKAVELARDRTDKSSHEIVLEPHYKLVSTVVKYVQAEKLDPVEALELVEQTPYCEVHSNVISPVAGRLPDTPINRFYDKAVYILLRMKHADKKRWQHRPIYRLAKLYADVYGDKQLAKEEMSNCFGTSKNNAKVPVHFWKPDLERPGQHFMFAYQYIMFWVNLLRDTEDATGLSNLTRKTKKFGQGMAKHLDAWDHMLTTTAQTVKALLHLTPKYSDTIIPTLIYDTFVKTSQGLIKKCESSEREDLPSLVTALNFGADMRRLNNGQGSTAQLDDLFVAIYLRLYSSYAESVVIKEEPKLVEQPTAIESTTKIQIKDLLTPSAESTPQPEKEPPSGATKVRVTRRDIILQANALLKAVVPKLGNGDDGKAIVYGDPRLSIKDAQQLNTETKKREEGENIESTAKAEESNKKLPPTNEQPGNVGGGVENGSEVVRAPNAKLESDVIDSTMPDDDLPEAKPETGITKVAPQDLQQAELKLAETAARSESGMPKDLSAESAVESGINSVGTGVTDQEDAMEIDLTGDSVTEGQVLTPLPLPISPTEKLISEAVPTEPEGPRNGVNNGVVPPVIQVPLDIPPANLPPQLHEHVTQMSVSPKNNAHISNDEDDIIIVDQVVRTKAHRDGINETSRPRYGITSSLSDILGNHSTNADNDEDQMDID
ncbi:hypothetical protein TRVA0_003S00518 [Trichomonascus vanleenenianus]|uniref:Hir3p n=1 Tax=Trichomonascus vanleenenianus TaxID=2268995 RepID=UPI003ECAB004